MFDLRPESKRSNHKLEPIITDQLTHFLISLCVKPDDLESFGLMLRLTSNHHQVCIKTLLRWRNRSARGT